MDNTATNNPLGSFLNLAQQFATPFAKTLVYGKDRASEMELTKERAQMEALNGSGPVNPDLAVQQSSKSLMDFLHGNPATRGEVQGAPNNNLMLILLGLVGLVLVIFMVKR